jgi:hypothetical protein
MRIVSSLVALLALGGCAVQGNPNQAVRRPYYVEPEAASLDLNFLPMALRMPACGERDACHSAGGGNAGRR